MVNIQSFSNLFQCEFEKFENNEKGKNALKIGFEEFDELTGGFPGGSLITIGGRTAMGKTALAINITKNVVLKGMPVLYFNLESTNQMFMDKFTSCAMGINYQHIRNSLMTEEDWEKFDKSIKNISSLPLYLSSPSEATIDELCNSIVETTKTNGIKLVIIDYIQLLYTKVSAPSDNRYNDLNYYTRRLKSLAKELNIPIILISQLNRNVEKEKDSYSIYSFRPRLIDLRDSGTICEDSDLVIFLYRPEYYNIYEDEKGHDLHGIALLIIAKNRFGPTVDFNLSCKLDYVQFYKEEPSDPFPDAEIL